MKKIISISLILLGVVFLAGCGLQQTNQTQSTNVDLTTPEKSFIFCRKAFQETNEKSLKKCLSDELLKDLNRDGETYISLWKGSFEACGGYNRKITSVTMGPCNTINCFLKSDNEAVIIFEEHDGCQNSLKMKKESDGWKFNER
jgi:hypothetical protein